MNRLEGSLRADGYDGDLLLLHSGGGSMTPAMVDRYPVRLAASGIAAGAIAVADIASRCGYPNAIGLDMGGTSTDISLVYDGEIRTTKRWQVEYGFPICFPSIEVLTIGAGGGSLAWIDEAGSLRNGPQSAGAAPGPACYQRGGTEPTNTDANLVLGRLGESLIGGELTLDAAAAREAVRTGISSSASTSMLTPPHRNVIQVANANMADAVRLLSIRRGYRPPRLRPSRLLAGPAHSTVPPWPKSCRSPRSRCRLILESPRRKGVCSSTFGTTCRRCSSASPPTSTQQSSSPNSRSSRRRASPGSERGASMRIACVSTARSACATRDNGGR